MVNNQNLSALRPGSKCFPSWVGWNAFLDPLLGRATSIVKVNQPGGLCAQMGHDETDSRKEFPAMPLHLGNDPTRPVPTGGWIAEIGKPDDGLSGWGNPRAGLAGFQSLPEAPHWPEAGWHTRSPSPPGIHKISGLAKAASPRKYLRTVFFS